MSIWVTSVVIPVGVSLATSTLYGVTLGPRLAARNKRVQAAHDCRDQLNEAVLDVLALCSNLETVAVPSDLPDEALGRLLAERERWVSQIDERTVWLVDHWQRFALTYVGLAGMRNILAEYVMVARGVWLSGRSLEERVRLLRELTEPVQGLYFTARWRMVTRIVRERARLRRALDHLGGMADRRSCLTMNLARSFRARHQPSARRRMPEVRRRPPEIGRMAGEIAVLKFTLDHNCIVDLDEGREPRAGCLRSLLARHEAGDAVVRLVAASASERQRNGPYLENFGQFQERLAALGLGHLELLAPVLVVDVSYLDWCVLAGEEDIAFMRQIHGVLFPGHCFDLQDALASADGQPPEVIERKWRNRELDVQALWCHIHYGGDVFVTSDQVFFRKEKREPLARLRAGKILRPCEAVAA